MACARRLGTGLRLALHYPIDALKLDFCARGGVKHESVQKAEVATPLERDLKQTNNHVDDSTTAPNKTKRCHRRHHVGLTRSGRRLTARGPPWHHECRAPAPHPAAPSARPRERQGRAPLSHACTRVGCCCIIVVVATAAAAISHIRSSSFTSIVARFSHKARSETPHGVSARWVDARAQ